MEDRLALRVQEILGEARAGGMTEVELQAACAVAVMTSRVEKHYLSEGMEPVEASHKAQAEVETLVRLVDAVTLIRVGITRRRVDTVAEGPQLMRDSDQRQEA